MRRHITSARPGTSGSTRDSVLAASDSFCPPASPTLSGLAHVAAPRPDGAAAPQSPGGPELRTSDGTRRDVGASTEWRREVGQGANRSAAADAETQPIAPPRVAAPRVTVGVLATEHDARRCDLCAGPGCARCDGHGWVAAREVPAARLTAMVRAARAEEVALHGHGTPPPACSLCRGDGCSDCQRLGIEGCSWCGLALDATWSTDPTGELAHARCILGPAVARGWWTREQAEAAVAGGGGR